MKTQLFTLFLGIILVNSHSYAQQVIQNVHYVSSKYGYEVNFPTQPTEKNRLFEKTVQSTMYGKSTIVYKVISIPAQIVNFNAYIKRMIAGYEVEGFSVNHRKFKEGKTKIIDITVTHPSYFVQRCIKYEGVIHCLTVENSTSLPDNDMIFPLFYSFELPNGFRFIQPYPLTENDLSYVKQDDKPVTPPVAENEIKPETPAVQKTIAPSDVDINIPVSGTYKESTYALIIGNEDYESYQMGLSEEVNVAFAVNDARIFKTYCQNTLGIPEINITLLTNARAVDMHRAVDKINLLAKNAQGEAEIVFYYAGHGLPDESTKEPYLIPVDVSGKDLKFAIALSDLYEKLNEHPTRRITVFLDACFSGGARNQGLVEARAVKVKPKENVLLGSIIVFSASSDEQSSLPYKDKQHGIFTYFLLKKLQETAGELSYGELADYLVKKVGINSVLINEKEQNPQVSVSQSVQEEWKDWKMK